MLIKWKTQDSPNELECDLTILTNQVISLGNHLC